MSDTKKRNVHFSSEVRREEFFEISDNRNDKFKKYVRLYYNEILSEMLINKQKNVKLLLALNIAQNYE